MEWAKLRIIKSWCSWATAWNSRKRPQVGIEFGWNWGCRINHLKGSKKSAIINWRIGSRSVINQKVDNSGFTWIRFVYFWD